MIAPVLTSSFTENPKEPFIFGDNGIELGNNLSNKRVSLHDLYKLCNELLLGTNETAPAERVAQLLGGKATSKVLVRQVAPFGSMQGVSVAIRTITQYNREILRHR